jgi:predicted deacylase
MATTLTVGSATAAPGTLTSGWIDVPDGVDPGTRIPVTVANGTTAGPVLALIAGTHGSEYTSILALQRLRPKLEPARMRGAAILVHMANPPSFYGRRVYYSPDGKNLNRMYPASLTAR